MVSNILSLLWEESQQEEGESRQGMDATAFSKDEAAFKGSGEKTG